MATDGYPKLPLDHCTFCESAHPVGICVKSIFAFVRSIIYMGVAVTYSHTLCRFVRVRTEGRPPGQRFVEPCRLQTKKICSGWTFHAIGSTGNVTLLFAYESRNVVSCTCSCVFYNGFLFMKYILAQEDIHVA